MPRKTRRVPLQSPVRPRITWTGYILTAVLAAGLGSGATYFLTRPMHRSSPVPTAPPSLPADAARVLGYWYEDHQDWPQAITLLTQAVAGGLDNPDVRTDLGIAYFKSGQPQKALDQYGIAQGENSHHENSLFNQGVAYVQLGNPGQAILIWRQYIQRFPQGQHVTDARALIAQLQVQGHGPFKQ